MPLSVVFRKEDTAAVVSALATLNARFPEDQRSDDVNALVQTVEKLLSNAVNTELSLLLTQTVGELEDWQRHTTLARQKLSDISQDKKNKGAALSASSFLQAYPVPESPST